MIQKKYGLAGYWRKPMRMRCVSLLLLCLFFLVAASPVPEGVNSVGTDGAYIWEQGFFRVIYHLEGEHAVSPGDADKNGVPDFVEDLAKQLLVAHHIFCDIAGFRNPLQAPRSRQPRYVDVYIYNRTKLQKYSGLAFFNPVRSRYAPDANASSLLIHIANDIQVQGNSTPAHEYFHLIQYGMTKMINSWYLEGMAVWSQDAIEKRKIKSSATCEGMTSMLRSPEGRKKLQAAGYNGAKILWIPLANLCQKDTVTLSEDDPVLQLTYSDGTAIMQDYLFPGTQVMKQILEGLASIEHMPFEQYNYTKWSRENRTSLLNDSFIFTVIQNSVDEICHK